MEAMATDKPPAPPECLVPPGERQWQERGFRQGESCTQGHTAVKGGIGVTSQPWTPPGHLLCEDFTEGAVKELHPQPTGSQCEVPGHTPKAPLLGEHEPLGNKRGDAEKLARNLTGAGRALSPPGSAGALSAAVWCVFVAPATEPHPEGKDSTPGHTRPPAF